MGGGGNYKGPPGTYTSDALIYILVNFKLSEEYVAFDYWVN